MLTQSCIVFCRVPGLPQPCEGSRQAFPSLGSAASLHSAEQIPDLEELRKAGEKTEQIHHRDLGNQCLLLQIKVT